VVDQSLEGRGIEENIQDRKETSQWWVDEFIYFLECLRFKLWQKEEKKVGWVYLFLGIIVIKARTGGGGGWDEFILFLECLWLKLWQEVEGKVGWLYFILGIIVIEVLMGWGEGGGMSLFHSWKHFCVDRLHNSRHVWDESIFLLEWYHVR